MFGVILGWQQGWGAVSPVDWTSQAKAALMQRYPTAQIELGEKVTIERGQIPASVSSVGILEENMRGEVRLSLTDQDSNATAEVRVPYVAVAKVWVAKKRVHPGERLIADDFMISAVNLSSPNIREFRGLILTAHENLAQLEARQTLLEGQYIMMNAVQKIPDVRRGDPITVRIMMDGMTLSTAGMAEEPAYLNGSIKIMTSKTKRNLTGKLVERGVVEVSL